MRIRIRRRVMVRRRFIPRRVRHHPLVRAATVVVLVLVLLGIANRTVASASDARRRWGQERSVVVARRRIAIGETIPAEAIETQSWPAALIPPGAIAASPVGRTATAAIEPGEAVVAPRLAPDGLHGVAALVPIGWRALAIPVGPSVVTLSIGDRVDLIAGFDAVSTSGDNAPAFVITENAIVVAVDEQRVTVAVRESDVARVVFAIVTGTVVPALRPT